MKKKFFLFNNTLTLLLIHFNYCAKNRKINIGKNFFLTNRFIHIILYMEKGILRKLLTVN